MAWVETSLGLDDMKEIYNNLSKLPKDVLKVAFSSGFLKYDSEEKEKEEMYSLYEVASNSESVTHVKNFVKEFQSRGYVFELNSNQVFDIDVIVSKLLEECSEDDIAIRHSGEEGIYEYPGIPKEDTDIDFKYIELSGNLYNTTKNGSASVLGDLVIDTCYGELVVYSTKTPTNPKETVLNVFGDYEDIYVTNIVLFDPEVVHLITTASAECSNKSDYTSISIEDSFSRYSSEDRYILCLSELTKVLVRCCPCLLNDYVWDYKTILPNEELVDLVASLGYCEEDIHKIFMEGDTPVMFSVNMKDVYVDAKIVDNFLKFLLVNINVPIKECYILDRGCYLKGNVIGRRCKDGEYIVTIY